MNIFRVLEKCEPLREYLIIYFKKKAGERENLQGIVKNPVLFDQQYANKILKENKDLFELCEYNELLKLCKGDKNAGEE